MITIKTLARILGVNEDRLRRILDETMTYWDEQRDRIHEPDVMQFLEEQIGDDFARHLLVRLEVRMAMAIETPR